MVKILLILLASFPFFKALKWAVEKDFNLISQEISIDHRTEWKQKAKKLLLPISILSLSLFIDFKLIKLLIPLISSGLCAFIWWEFFDGWLNKKRNRSWRFNGSEDKDDAISDNILQGLKPYEQLLLKWGLIIIFIVLYFII